MTTGVQFPISTLLPLHVWRVCAIDCTGFFDNYFIIIIIRLEFGVSSEELIDEDNGLVSLGQGYRGAVPSNPIGWNNGSIVVT